MGELIYRYISFAQFVDMIQSKTLCFVSPNVWDDIYEKNFLYQWQKSLQGYELLLSLLLDHIVYAQSWTSLAESDAMWRIYSYDKQSIRIKIDSSDVHLLNDVIIEPVTYNDDLTIISYNNDDFANTLRRLISQKRAAFKHEEEIRLLFIPRHTTEEISSGIETLIFISKVYDQKREKELPDYPLDKLDRDIEMFNINDQRKTEKIPFDHIPNFIKGVLVNPLAPMWYVKTVERYCEINNIPFEGQSKLYTEENNE